MLIAPFLSLISYKRVSVSISYIGLDVYYGTVEKSVEQPKDLANNPTPDPNPLEHSLDVTEAWTE